MSDQQKPWRIGLLAAAGALLIAYAFHPLITVLMATTEGRGGELITGMPLAGETVIFLLILFWKLRKPRGLHGLERSVFFSAWLFLLFTPGVIIAGLFLPDASTGGALVFTGLIFGGFYAIQSIILFACGSALRSRRLNASVN